MRGAARLGWMLARTGTTEPPEVEVMWAESGAPLISVIPTPLASASNWSQPSADTGRQRSDNWLQRLNAYNARIVQDQAAGLEIIRRTLRAQADAPPDRQPDDPS